MQKQPNQPSVKKQKQNIKLVKGISTLQQPRLVHQSSIQSEPALHHKTSSLSQESLTSNNSRQSAEQLGSRTSKLQIIAQKVSSMVKCSPKITLDSIKMTSIQEFKNYLEIIQNPEIVTHFTKNNLKLGDEVISCLDLKKFKSLTFLSLENANITAHGLKTLAATQIPKLKYLYLARNRIGDCEINQVVFQLNLLSLTDNKISSEGVRKLRNLFMNLESLTLKLNPIKSQGLKQLLQNKLPNLRYLHLQSCELDQTAFSYFSEKRIENILPKIVTLSLSNNPITSKGLSYILGSSVMKSIESLNISDCHLSSPTLSGFKQNQEHLAKLTSLNISKNNLTDDMVKDIACTKLPSVHLINLQHNCMSIQSIKLFSKSQYPELQHFRIDHNKGLEGCQKQLKSLCICFYSVAKQNHAKVFFNV